MLGKVKMLQYLIHLKNKNLIYLCLQCLHNPKLAKKKKKKKLFFILFISRCHLELKDVLPQSSVGPELVPTHVQKGVQIKRKSKQTNKTRSLGFKNNLLKSVCFVVKTCTLLSGSNSVILTFICLKLIGEKNLTKQNHSRKSTKRYHYYFGVYRAWEVYLALYR